MVNFLAAFVSLMYYDIIIFNVINGFAGQSKILDGLGIFLADYVPYVLGFILLYFLFWSKSDRVKNRAMVLIAMSAGLFARFGVKTAIVLFYPRFRPYVVLPSAQKLIGTFAFDNWQSFPSGHALFFFATSTVIYRYNKKLGIFFFIGSAVMGIARVFVGVHWPSDILGGLILGCLVGFAANWVYLKTLNSQMP